MLLSERSWKRFRSNGGNVQHEFVSHRGLLADWKQMKAEDHGRDLAETSARVIQPARIASPRLRARGRHVQTRAGYHISAESDYEEMAGLKWIDPCSFFQEHSPGG